MEKLKVCACGCGKEIVFKKHHKYRNILYIHGHNPGGKQFEKGQHPWNYKLTNETDERVRKISSKKIKEKKRCKCLICNKDVVVIPSRKVFKYCSYGCYWNSLIGKSFCKETEFKEKLFHTDKTYIKEFNNRLKDKIRKRDNYRCQECFREQDELYDKNGRKYKLCIHHIDYDKKNCNENNLISLCRNCHQQTNFDCEDWQEYFKDKGVNKK